MTTPAPVLSSSSETRITWASVAVNAGLTSIKLVGGIVGHSQALVADAAHSVSDFATDLAVLVGLRMSRKPRDEDHPYGHGQFEVLAAMAIGLALGFVALKLGAGALRDIVLWNSSPHTPPSTIAFVLALVSVAVKEALYRATMRVARATGSSALAANAWHHRSDALSSLPVAAGIGAAAFLGGNWKILDPVAALFVSIILLWVGVVLIREQVDRLTDHSLSPALCEEILEMARTSGGITEPHNLRTRMVGRHPVIDLHVRLPADLPLRDAHALASRLEDAYIARFGPETIVTLHLEPTRDP